RARLTRSATPADGVYGPAPCDLHARLQLARVEVLGPAELERAEERRVRVLVEARALREVALVLAPLFDPGAEGDLVAEPGKRRHDRARLVGVVERGQLVDRRGRDVLPIEDVGAAVLEVVHQPGELDRLLVDAEHRGDLVVRAARGRVSVPERGRS